MIENSGEKFCENDFRYIMFKFEINLEKIICVLIHIIFLLPMLYYNFSHLYKIILWTNNEKYYHFREMNKFESMFSFMNIK